ncbi:CGNR zinc finger domain-containing protein [Streptomyces aureocirculatus]|uniref:CGNR zinc finger domain-containing protein n=1 Tax=Streptomyces aureocirculatus TaxID=67275 RepID=UPI0004C8044B|nr:CGNR zinc finger domain-containing protein [Streptomyces aureocirculatus]
MRPPDGQVYRFDPGALCLELLATGGPGAFARFETLHAPADLLAWTAQSRIGPCPGLTATERELAAVRELRDALFLFTADHAHGRPWDPRHLELLNDAAAAPPLAARIEADGSRAWAPGATATGLLSTVARDAVDLFTGPHASRVRECAAHDCFLLFVDTSRPGRRRWCAMERCGNRAKARTHRATKA